VVIKQAVVKKINESEIVFERGGLKQRIKGFDRASWRLERTLNGALN
jgi:hypothetical protein